jgi:hypothetical protein
MTAMDFRMYDNVLGRFFGIDALSEQNHYLSTYQFGDGNPVVFSDPSGLDSQGGYDPKDVWGKHGAGAWANQYTNSQYNAINAGNSGAGGGGSSGNATFAELDKKIDDFLEDSDSPDIVEFQYLNGQWDPYYPTGIMLEAVTVTRSMGNLVFPIEKMQKIIETAQKRFNARFGAVGGNGGGGNRDGWAIQFTYGFALLGGPSFSLGYVEDSSGKGKWYTSLGGSIGLGYNVGFDHFIIKSKGSHKFSVNDWVGTSHSYNYGFGPFSKSNGQSVDTNRLKGNIEHFMPSLWGNNARPYSFQSQGIGYGGDAGFMWTSSQTWFINP